MLNNNIGSFDSAQINTESRKNMLKSFQMMLEIEERAQKKFTQILSDIQAGKTTLDEVKKQRGLL